jgi:hypothetical protein
MPSSGIVIVQEYDSSSAPGLRLVSTKTASHLDSLSLVRPRAWWRRWRSCSRGGLSAGQVAGYALLAGVAGALAELLATRVDDNLTIPVAVGGAVSVVAAFLG